MALLYDFKKFLFRGEKMDGESDFKENKIAIIGLGLIGGSLGLSLKCGTPDLKIIGIDREEIINKAIIRGAVDGGTDCLQEGVKDADIVIIATPVKVILNLLPKIKPFLKKDCLVTDTGSTKVEILAEAEKAFSNKVDFIGGHPIAGLEKGGIEHATPALFRKKPYLVTPKKGNNVTANQKLSSLINHIGAWEMEIDSQEHDQIVALISHLPHLIAVIMANMFGLWAKEKNKKDYFKINGNAFQDMTRVATSPFNIWRDIYETNTEYTIYFLEQLEKWLAKTKEKIARNPSELEEDFEMAKSFKEKMLNIKVKGIE